MGVEIMGGVIKHNMSRTPIYKSYHSMMSRCYDQKHKAYKYYGGRPDTPIRVCARWHDIGSFLEDAVKLPNYSPCRKGMTLDRIDPNGDYCPENCRWATNLEQQNNKRNNVILHWNDKNYTMSQLAREIGVRYSVFTGIYYWNKDKMSIDEIVNRAVASKNHTINIAKVARENNVPYGQLYHQYVTNGNSLEDAIQLVRNGQKTERNRT